jgi:hypothetical protein
MVVAPYLAATILAVAGITAASLLMLATGFAIYRNFKITPLYPIQPSSAENPEIFSDSASSTSTFFDTLSSQQRQNSNYYHREFRSEKLTNNQATDKNFLVTEIGNKIESLRQQKESSKRRAKIQFLGSLKDKIETNDTGNTPPPSNKVFQSFFKAIGDVEDGTF